MPAPTLSTATQVVNGVTLFERRAVAGGPEVVVLHGGPGAHHDYLLPGFDRLATGRTLIYYDQRGGGRSSVPREVAVGWHEQVSDLEALRQVWGHHQLDLVGYSWGALLAMLYATTHPGRIRSLALVSPAPAAGRERPGYEQTLAARGDTAAIRAARADLKASDLKERDPEAYQRRLFELAVAGYFHDPARARELTPFRITGRTQQEVWASLGDDYDLRPALGALQVPAMVLHGDDDPIPLATAAATARALGTEVVALAACGHVPYVEAADRFSEELDRFLPRE